MMTACPSGRQLARWEAGVAAGGQTQGWLALQAFCQRGDVVVSVDDGFAFHARDRLRFSYSAPAVGHLMIFGVDDRGRIFPYYGEGSLSSIPVEAGTNALLPGSIKLEQ